jgi:glycerol-3-phosphate dehydrogenase
LLRSVAEYFPTLDSTQIYFSNAGVRARWLAPAKEEGSTSSVSRRHRIADEAKSGAGNPISVLGGKMTGDRAIAEEVVDAVCAS